MVISRSAYVAGKAPHYLRRGSGIVPRTTPPLRVIDDKMQGIKEEPKQF